MEFDRHGAQGILDRASNAQLESEFGTHVIDDIAKVILEKGAVITNKVCWFLFGGMFAGCVCVRVSVSC